MTVYDNKIISCPISGGINSAAVLCYLHEIGAKPKELHLFYAHFKQHSPGTYEFVQAQFEFAKTHFDKVITTVTQNDVLQFFREQKMIPHPMVSPCSRILKIIPMMQYNAENGVELDLVGYVKKEYKRRAENPKKKATPELFTKSDYPVKLFDDDWCFEIVDKYIGWHPAIYDIRGKDGKRVFKHNNCLPCKNMTIKDMEAVAEYYPEYMAEAVELSNELKAYFGRNADDFYTSFGKQDYETRQCETCSFD